nr:conjugal transfer protein TraE [Clostridium botulinum]
MNDIYGKASALRNINSEYNFMSAFNKLKSKRIIISINFKSINSSKILELVEENINLDFKTEAFIPYQFRNSIQDIRKNLIDSISRKENLFLVNCKFINISKDLDALEKDYENMNLILKFNDYRIHELIYEQKQGLNDSLFLGNNDLKINETLTLDELLKLMPF